MHWINVFQADSTRLVVAIGGVSSVNLAFHRVIILKLVSLQHQATTYPVRDDAIGFMRLPVIALTLLGAVIDKVTF
jgi:hypothetical protein